GVRANRRDMDTLGAEVAERAAEAAGIADGALGINPLIGFTAEDIRAALEQVARQAFKQPRLALKHVAGFLAELGGGLGGTSTLAPDPKDRRFLDPAWKTSRVNRAALHAYLAWQTSLNGFVDDAELPGTDAERARFVLALLTDALAPTNTLLGNPAALKK